MPKSRTSSRRSTRDAPRRRRRTDDESIQRYAVRFAQSHLRGRSKHGRVSAKAKAAIGALGKGLVYSLTNAIRRVLFLSKKKTVTAEIVNAAMALCGGGALLTTLDLPLPASGATLAGSCEKVVSKDGKKSRGAPAAQTLKRILASRQVRVGTRGLIFLQQIFAKTMHVVAGRSLMRLPKGKATITPSVLGMALSEMPAIVAAANAGSLAVSRNQHVLTGNSTSKAAVFGTGTPDALKRRRKGGKRKAPKRKSAKGKSAKGKSAKGKSAKGKSAKGKSAKGKAAKGKAAKGKAAKGKAAKGKARK
jgi:hypothetical protein